MKGWNVFRFFQFQGSGSAMVPRALLGVGLAAMLAGWLSMRRTLQATVRSTLAASSG